jgi:hypothetical protein
MQYFNTISSLGRYGLYTLLFFCCTFLLLLTPKPVTLTTSTYIAINSKMGFLKNTDANEFVQRAIHPQDVLRVNECRQSRPLTIIVAAGIGKLFNACFNYVGLHDKVNQAFYSAYIFINYLLLWLSVFYFYKILKHYDVPDFYLFFATLFLIINNISKVFLFTAHQQFFIPIFILHLFITWQYQHNFQFRRNFLNAFLLGFLFLAYGSFIIYLPILFLIMVFNYSKFNVSVLQLIVQFSMSCIVFLLPFLIWYCYIIMLNGSFYSAEVLEYHQFVWLVQSVNAHHLFATCYNNIVLYFSSLVSIEILPFLLLAIIITFYFLLKKEMSYFKSYGSIYIVLLVVFIFLFLIGYYQQRLNFNLVPIILLFLTILFSNSTFFTSKFQKQLCYAILSIIWAVMHIVQYGPFE